MSNDIIDVEFYDVPMEQGDDNIPTNTNENPISIDIENPLNVTIHELFGSIRAFSNDIKEYKMVKAQEKTKQAAIKANMKIHMAEIDAQKEACIKALDYKHAENMEMLKSLNSLLLKALDIHIESIKGAIECAKNNNDFSEVKGLLEKLNDCIKVSAECRLDMMDKMNTNIHNLPLLPE